MVGMGLIGAVGTLAKSRLCLLSGLLRPQAGDWREPALLRQTLKETASALGSQQVLIADAGFSLSEVLALNVARFVLRRDKNVTARRNGLPAYSGKGRHRE